MTVTSRSVKTLAPPAILAKIERDCEANVGHAFLTLAADYLAQTRGREGRVSTVHTPAGLAARFKKPAPRTGHSIDAIVSRLRSDVMPNCNHLHHPQYMGHQLAGPEPAAI